MADRFHGTPLSRAHISEDLNKLLEELDNSDSGKTGGDILEALIADAANTKIAMLTAETSSAGGKLELKEATANGTSKVTFQSPAALGGDRVITVPDAAVDLGDIAGNTAKVSATAANIKSALAAGSTELGIGLNQADYPDEKNNLVVGATSGNNGVSIVSSGTGVSSLAFRNNTSNNSGEGIIDYSGNTKTMRFMTNGLNTALSIDTSQNATFSGTVEATKYKKAVLAGITAASSAAGGSTTSEVVTDKTIVIPANTLVAGDRLQVRFGGILTCNGTPAATVKLKITDAAGGGANAYTLLSAADAELSTTATVAGGRADLAFLTVGSSGKLDAVANGFTDTTSMGSAVLDSTIDTTTNITISVSITFGTAHASNTFTLRELSAIQASI